MPTICTLTASDQLFRQLIQPLVLERGFHADAPLGTILTPGDESCEFILARMPPPDGELLRVRLVAGAFPNPEEDLRSPAVRAVLYLGDRDRLGEARGFVLGLHGNARPLTHLKLVGAGLHHVSLEPALHPPGDRAVIAGVSARWARSRQALGTASHDTATALQVGIIGCGRTGSLLASHLARFGIGSLVLVDPDVVELTNLGESEFGVDDLGQPKVVAMRRRLRSDFPGMRLEAVQQSAAQLRALEALKRCDFLFAAPDQPAPRLVAALLAAAFARPLIDIGTQIHRQPGTSLMGADVRLILPDRCLFCYGGARGEAAGWQLLRDPEQERHFLRTRDGAQERQGSLRSLNSLAVALALRLYEDWVTGRVAGSTWCHTEWDTIGQLTVSYRQPTNGLGNACACAWAGWADSALPRLQEFLRLRTHSALS